MRTRKGVQSGTAFTLPSGSPFKEPRMLAYPVNVGEKCGIELVKGIWTRLLVGKKKCYLCSYPFNFFWSHTFQRKRADSILIA
jgi:hypothetical protein